MGKDGRRTGGSPATTGDRKGGNVRNMKVTIKDVARKAGVSTATVSYVINKKKNVSEATEEKVLEAMKELGYYPDGAARSFRTGKKNMVAVIVPFLSNDIFTSIVEAAERVFAESGYHVLVSSSGDSREKELENIRVLSSGLVDGIMISSCCRDIREIQKIVPEGFPVVMFDRILEGEGHSSVEIDDETAVREAVAYLVHKGHRNIGILEGFEQFSTVARRKSAYERVFREKQIKGWERYVHYSRDYEEDLAEVAFSYLEQGCTAFLFATPMILWKVRDGLERRNVNFSAIETAAIVDTKKSKYFMKNTSLIQWPLVELGGSAARQLVRHMENSGEKEKHIILQSTFIPREYADYFLL